ncbi:UvrD-helicase domain-containing protein, partial [Escherichia coli]|uniref:UvrD-helicase domain-containing protein n=1 Tax=Escherichia coli TaxID=562 RepID=UPI000CB4828C
LNGRQGEAVAAPRGNLLVVAGGGGGTTRVLVHRIAWLMSVENCSPYSIMAVTVSNKTAAGVGHRIGQLMGTRPGGLGGGALPGRGPRPPRAGPMDAGSFTHLPAHENALDLVFPLLLVKKKKYTTVIF